MRQFSSSSGDSGSDKNSIDKKNSVSTSSKFLMIMQTFRSVMVGLSVRVLERSQCLKYVFGLEHLPGMGKLVLYGIEDKKLQSDIAILI